MANVGYYLTIEKDKCGELWDIKYIFHVLDLEL